MKKLFLLFLLGIIDLNITAQTYSDKTISLTLTIGVSHTIVPYEDSGIPESIVGRCYDPLDDNYTIGSYELSNRYAISVIPQKKKNEHNFDCYSYNLTAQNTGFYTFRQSFTYLKDIYGTWVAYGGPTITYNITVVDVIGISIPHSISLNDGDTYTFSPIVSQQGATTTLSWFSSDTSVAAIDTNGNLTTVGLGKTTITCTAHNGISAQCDVTVSPVLVSAITMNKTEATLEADAPQEQLTATVLPENATNKAVTWTSSNPSVATVDENGLVTAVSAGTTTITATTADGTNLTATCEVTVDASISNYLSLTDVTGLIGAQCVLPISMCNTESIKGIQFDLQLPEGVTVATNEYDEMMFTLTSRAHSSHAVSANRLGNGDYRVVVSSLSAKTFKDTEGVIMNVTLNVDKNLSIGDYGVNLFSIVLNTADNVPIIPNDVTATLTLSDVAPGDVNGDGNINVTDVGMVIDHILEHTPSGFIAEAADVNGDGNINVTDVGLIIDIILSDNFSREVLMIENTEESVEEIHEPQ